MTKMIIIIIIINNNNAKNDHYYYYYYDTLRTSQAGLTAPGGVCDPYLVILLLLFIYY